MDPIFGLIFGLILPMFVLPLLATLFIWVGLKGCRRINNREGHMRHNK